MKYETLKRIVDADSLTATVWADNSITKYHFTINGAKMEAQSDPDNFGVYGFGLSGDNLLTLLNLDDDGWSI